MRHFRFDRRSQQYRFSWSAMSSTENVKKPVGHEGVWAACGFALVLLVIGLPIWWQTTMVYRAVLPYAYIDELASHKARHRIHVKLITQDKNGINRLEKYLKDNEVIKYSVSSRLPTPEEINTSKISNYHELDSKLSRLLHIHDGALGVFVMPLTSDMPAVLLGNHRTVYVQPNISMEKVAKILESMAWDSSITDKVKSKLVSVDERKKQIGPGVRRQVPTEPGYDLTLTLMVPEPHFVKAKWEIRSAVEEYLNPMLDQIRNVADITVRSQVLYVTSLNIAPQWSDSHKHYKLPEEQLPLTINSIESKLGSFVSTRPSLHFVVYIPSSGQSPLHIHTQKGEVLQTNSFLVPRWGSVMIHNVDIPPYNESVPLPIEVSVNTYDVMNLVVSQLHKLLPIPLLESDKDLKILEPVDSRLAGWQLDALARARVSTYLTNTRITLQSLCELVGEISNMVISDEVGGWVWGAVEEWGACQTAATEGRLLEASQYCTEAFARVDKAFFHPSMLALLYFPDNQKYAIYVPLFLPVSIPVILSLRTIFAWVKAFLSRKEKKD
ncbi:phosphatidylinositol glycan anchor biosynthesis class S isoform X2 [Oratosquilla oratoria]|uniref:phosphatidylinositol glycan anchor biosynthesis class S isoform X2 n=1 Tax=Oratosquilla oratoria TaxID=337810 RepID=UPI003F75FD26